MKSIYSSKLYRASKRKDRIQAALAAPGNSSLVQQLAEDLDEEYRTPENLGLDNKDSETSEGDAEGLMVDEDIDPSKDLMTVSDLGGHSGGGMGPLGPKPDISDRDGGSDEPSDVPDLDSEGDSEPSEEPNTEEPAEASTKIQSCTQINLTVFKDSLNSREDTCGVSRIAEKENELWVYYKDEVNLNNLMTEVIEYASVYYPSLEFNRLARSDNAIVFLEVESTVPDAGTVEPLEEGDKKE